MTAHEAFARALEALREHEPPGKWQRGMVGNADLVRYDGDDIVGIAFIGGEKRIDYIAALHNAAPELIAAARRLEALEEAMRWFNEGCDNTSFAVCMIQERADQILKERSK